MKYALYFLFLLGLLYKPFQTQAQQYHSLAEWTFNGSSNLPMNIDSRITATPAIFSVGRTGYISPGADPNSPQSFTHVYTASPSSLTSMNLPGMADPAGGQSYAADSWPSSATRDNTKYLEFTITPRNDAQNQNTHLRVTEIHFDHITQADGPQTFDVVALTRFGNPMILTTISFGSGSSTKSWQRYVASVAAQELYEDTQEPITFRIYGYSASGSEAPWRIDNIAILGVTNNDCICQLPQPVELTYFQGKSVGKQVQLRWETSWERNASHFVVERSADAGEFEAIGQVQAAGDAAQNRQYGFADGQPLLGTGYYRLRQVDNDGAVEHSKVIAVKLDPDQPALTILGNPGNGRQITLSLYKVDATTLQLTDLLGRRIGYRLLTSSPAQTTLEPTSLLSPGTYLLQAGGLPPVRLLVNN